MEGGVRAVGVLQARVGVGEAGAVVRGRERVLAVRPYAGVLHANVQSVVLGGTVTVEVTAENDRLDVRVEDTGVGPGDEDPLSVSDDSTGLANTDTRLQHTYGPEIGRAHV